MALRWVPGLGAPGGCTPAGRGDQGAQRAPRPPGAAVSSRKGPALRRASVRPPGPFQALLENPEGVHEPRVAARKEQEPHVAVRTVV